MRARAFGASASLYILFAAGVACAGAPTADNSPPPGNEGVIRIDYRTAIRLALENSFEIRGEQFGPLIAGAELYSERGLFDPELEIAAERAEGSSGSDDAGEVGATDIQLYRAGVTGTLPTGTQYGIQADSRNRTQDREVFDSFAGLTLTQPLLRGFGTNVTMAPIRVARLGVGRAGWDYRARVMDVVTSTALTYNDLCFARENLQVALRSQQLARQLLEDNSKRAEIGVMSPLDITEARAEVASREEAVILARREVLDQENALKRLVTDRIIDLLDVRMEVAPVQRFAPPAYTVREAVRAAFDFRPDYRSTLLELQQRRIQVIVAANETLPQIDLEGSLGLNGVDRGLWESMRSAFESGDSEWRAGVVVRVPFPNRTARGNRDARELEVARALVDLKNLEQEIVVLVDNAAGQIETTAQRIDATRQARILAQERLDAEQDRLAAGTTTTFVVLELQNDLAEAEVAELRALTDYNKAIITFEREAGLTLVRNKIELDTPVYRSGPTM